MTFNPLIETDGEPLRNLLVELETVSEAVVQCRAVNRHRFVVVPNIDRFAKNVGGKRDDGKFTLRTLEITDHVFDALHSVRLRVCFSLQFLLYAVYNPLLYRVCGISSNMSNDFVDVILRSDSSPIIEESDGEETV